MKAFNNSKMMFAVFLLTVGISSALYAEVGVHATSSGDFQSLNMTTKNTPEGIEYWSRTSSLPNQQVVNPEGDRIGDNPPVAVITSKTVGQPPTPYNDMAYVVWSRAFSPHRKLVFTYFANNSWGPVKQIVPSFHGSDGDALEPTLVAYQGVLYLAWWTNDEIPRIYYSKYDGNSWSFPQIVSDPTEASQFPSLNINNRNEVVLNYISYGGGAAGGASSNSLILEDCDP